MFNCSFKYQGISLNDQLLPGPTLSPSLIGVLLCFRQHPVAVSGDIKGMFYQVRLLPEDTPLLRFLWRNMNRDVISDVYEWQVLPFGTTSSPCCAIFAVQKHVRDNSDGYEDVKRAVENNFYVDNCLTSLSSTQEARSLLDRIRVLLSTGGFEVRQWASNRQSVVAHLPPDAQSRSQELWLARIHTDPVESTLGLKWNCASDTLRSQHKPAEPSLVTMRRIYHVLARQYDPLGFITTRAKVLVQ